MKLGAELSAPQDIATVRVEEERQAAKKQKNQWWAEESCKRLKKDLVNSRYPYLRGKCGWGGSVVMNEIVKRAGFLV